MDEDDTFEEYCEVCQEQTPHRSVADGDGIYECMSCIEWGNV